MVYKVKCLDAKFEETEGNLILNCWFEDLGAKKVVVMNKSDFSLNGGPVPDSEMHKTASLFKGKMYNLDVPDKELSEEEISKYEKMFSEGLHGQIDEVNKELLDPQKQLNRYIDSALKKDRFNRSTWKNV